MRLPWIECTRQLYSTAYATSPNAMPSRPDLFEIRPSLATRLDQYSQDRPVTSTPYLYGVNRYGSLHQGPCLGHAAAGLGWGRLFANSLRLGSCRCQFAPGSGIPGKIELKSFCRVTLGGRSSGRSSNQSTPQETVQLHHELIKEKCCYTSIKDRKNPGLSVHREYRRL